MVAAIEINRTKCALLKDLAVLLLKQESGNLGERSEHWTRQVALVNIWLAELSSRLIPQIDEPQSACPHQQQSQQADVHEKITLSPCPQQQSQQADFDENMPLSPCPPVY